MTLLGNSGKLAAAAFDVAAEITKRTPAGEAMAVTLPVVIAEAAPTEWICCLQQLGKNWRAMRVGTLCIVQRDNGSMLETVTSAPPYDLGGQPVVECKGVAGPYAMRLVYVRAKP
jgi:hypothetical protein